MINGFSIEEMQARGFNPLTHFPPKYDIYGNQKKQYNYGEEKYNILAERDRIKIPWDTSTNKSQTPMTQSKLIERRKLERIPDISYDLDKDGYVGGKDYVLAKRYDIDGDGKLNEQEKAAAYEGIKQGIEENYAWNLDNQGGKRPFRIMQKRGKIIDAEDFLPLQDTYPRHPLSDKIPKNGIKTKAELDQYRRNQTKEAINQKIKAWEEKNPPHFVVDTIDINLNKKPLYTSMEQIRDKMHRDARLNVGLSERENDIKITDKDPTLQYVYNPKHRTQQDLKDEIHRENMEQSKKLNSIVHKSDVERLNEREDEIFAKLYQKEPGLTYEKIKERRKKEIFDYNLKTFCQSSIGVHGHELPKFANSNMKEYWKFKDGYCENPKYQSQLELLESHKYWKKPEDMLLCEHREDIPPIDPFKKEMVPIKQKEEEFLKVPQINFYKGFDPKVVRPLDAEKAKKNHIYRWTTLVSKFAPYKFKEGRFFDCVTEEQPEEKEDVKQEMWKPTKEKKEQNVEKLNETKTPTDEPTSMPKMGLYQKFSDKDGLKFAGSTLVRSTAF